MPSRAVRKISTLLLILVLAAFGAAPQTNHAQSNQPHARVDIFGHPIDDGNLPADMPAPAAIKLAGAAPIPYFGQPSLLPNPSGYEAVSVATGFNTRAAAFNKVGTTGSRILTFTQQLTPTTIFDSVYGRPEAFAVTDLDGFIDGPDLVVGYANSSNGNAFMARKGFQPQWFPTGDGPHAAAHVQGVARDNVVISNWRTDYGTVVGANDNSIVSATNTLTMTQAGYNRLGAGNFCPNSGVAQDLVYMPGQLYSTPGAVIYCNGGSGNFSIGQTLPRPNQNELFRAVGVGDLNGDGRDDLVFANGENRPYGAIYIYYQKSTGGFDTSPNKTLAAYDIVEGIMIADVDYDGIDDIMMINAGWYAISVIHNYGDGGYDQYRVESHPYYFSHLQGNGAAMSVEGGHIVLYAADYNHGILRWEQSPPNPNRQISTEIKSKDGNSVDGVFSMPIYKTRISAKAPNIKSILVPSAYPPEGKLTVIIQRGAITDQHQADVDLTALNATAAYTLTTSFLADKGNYHITMTVRDLGGNIMAVGETDYTYNKVSGCTYDAGNVKTNSEVFPLKTNWGSAQIFNVPLGSTKAVYWINGPQNAEALHMTDCHANTTILFLPVVERQ